MSEENESNQAPELHPEVAALDEKLAAAHSDDMADADIEAFNALVDERNEAYRRNHPAPEAAEASES